MFKTPTYLSKSSTKRMHGLITTKHLLLKAPTIINEFGLGAYSRCLLGVLFAGRKKVTFLSCVMRLKQS